MAKLKASDILSEARAEKKKDFGKSLAQLAAERPSPYETELRAKLRDKTQFNFGPVPTFIVDIFYEEMEKSGCSTKKEFLYELLRNRGREEDIPPYEKMDGRKL